MNYQAKPPSPKILHNRVYCFNCNTGIESRHRWDFVACQCEGEKVICVDGGKDYFKRSRGKEANYKEFSQVEGEVSNDEEWHKLILGHV